MKNFNLILKLSAAVLLAGTTFHSSYAEPIKVVKIARDNPTIYFEGIPAYPDLDKAIRSFLRACGWYDVIPTNDANITLKAERNSDTLKLRAEMGGAPLQNIIVPLNGDTRYTAQQAVDALIEKSFRMLKVKGFCTTKIAFCAQTGKGVRNIYCCDIDGGNIRQITNYNTLCVEPCWFPNGRSIGYSRYTKTGIDVVETQLNPKRSRILTSLPGINAGAAISPDGKLLAVILSPDHQVDLYIVPVGSRDFRRITKSKGVESSPCWSPDGRELAFVSSDTGRPRINLVRSNGSDRRRLPSLGSEAVTPDWSGDGKIVYSTLVDGNYTLAVFDLKTQKNERITAAPGNWESPSWAADNRQVICKRTIGGKSSIWIVDSFTGKVRQLLSTPYSLSMPCWSKAQAR